MRATSYGIYMDAEWQVVFGNEHWMFAEHPVAREIMLNWIRDNITGERGKQWRISSYSMPPHVAFIDEEDALMCFLAFQ